MQFSKEQSYLLKLLLAMNLEKNCKVKLSIKLLPSVNNY